MNDLEIDHRHPIARGGSFGLDNLAITSARINQYKGNLTDVEFLLILSLLDTLDPVAKKDVLGRLRAGSSRFKKF